MAHKKDLLIRPTTSCLNMSKRIGFETSKYISIACYRCCASSHDQLTTKYFICLKVTNIS